LCSHSLAAAGKELRGQPPRHEATAICHGDMIEIFQSDDGEGLWDLSPSAVSFAYDDKSLLLHVIPRVRNIQDTVLIGLIAILAHRQNGNRATIRAKNRSGISVPRPCRLLMMTNRCCFMSRRLAAEFFTSCRVIDVSRSGQSL
jgi:hypothetical protein